MKERVTRDTQPQGIPAPTAYHVLIRPDYVDEYSEGGIILTNYDNQLDYEQNGACTGTVIAIGPTAWKNIDDGDPWCEVGKKVHFKRHVADLIPDPENRGKNLFLMTDNNILGVYDV